MTEHTLITQFTEIGREMYPGFISIKRREDGALILTVRTSGHAATSSMEMSAGALRRMAGEILAGVPAVRGDDPRWKPTQDPALCDCAAGLSVQHAPGEKPWCER